MRPLLFTCLLLLVADVFAQFDMPVMDADGIPPEQMQEANEDAQKNLDKLGIKSADAPCMCKGNGKAAYVSGVNLRVTGGEILFEIPAKIWGRE